MNAEIQRVAVVTGGSSGIGFATVALLAARGMAVVSGDIVEPTSLPSGASHCHVDLARADAGEVLLAFAADQFGYVNVLVNNVGIAPTRGGFATIPDADWHETWALDLMSAVRVTRAALPWLITSLAPSVVMTTSTTARTPDPYLVDYAVAKAGLITLTKSLAIELGPQGVRVNSVSPGSIRTPLWERPGGFIDSLAERLARPREAAVEYFIQEERRIPLGRAGTPEEVASAIAFLASSESSYITGIDLLVDGGSTRTV